MFSSRPSVTRHLNIRSKRYSILLNAFSLQPSWHVHYNVFWPFWAGIREHLTYLRFEQKEFGSLVTRATKNPHFNTCPSKGQHILIFFQSLDSLYFVCMLSHVQGNFDSRQTSRNTMVACTKRGKKITFRFTTALCMGPWTISPIASGDFLFTLLIEDFLKWWTRRRFCGFYKIPVTIPHNPAN
jgi:hypothetical protein